MSNSPINSSVCESKCSFSTEIKKNLKTPIFIPYPLNTMKKNLLIAHVTCRWSINYCERVRKSLDCCAGSPIYYSNSDCVSRFLNRYVHVCTLIGCRDDNDCMLRRFIIGKTIVGRMLAVILMQVGIIETLTSMITGFFSRD